MKETENALTEEATVKGRASCYHCGDPCKEVFEFDEKTFCCQGCVTVYDLLNSSGLQDYYQLNQSPGIKQKEARFDYLSNPEIVSQLLDFDSEQIAKVTLFIPAIHCSSCIWLLENMARMVPGIQRSRVQFIKKELNVTFSKSDVTFQQIVEFLSQIGYEPEINLASKSGLKPIKKRSSLGIKIGVAGFCFGNAMFISLPDYLDSNFLLENDFKFYFGLINVLLALPVLLYSASDYFKSAIGGLKKRFVNIDVPITLGIITLFTRSIYEIAMGMGTGYLDSMNGLVFFLLVGKWFQNKSYQALSFERDFKSFFPVAVEKVDAEVTSYIQVEKIEVGDFIVIHNNEILPVDAILTKGVANVDYSFVTGESVREQKHKGDLLYAGGRHSGPPITVRVNKEISSSYLTSLWNQETFSQDKDKNFQNSINRISSYFTVVVLAIALASGVYWSFRAPDEMWMVVSSILIVACPCALALSVPFAYGHTMRVFGRQNLYLRNADVVEKLSQIQQIIFDKTGTLTSARKDSVHFNGQLTGHEKDLVKTVTGNSFHPYSRQINQSLDHAGLLEIESFEEETGKGIKARVLGTEVLIGSASFCETESIGNQSAVFVKIEGEVKGYYTFQTGYRSGVLEVLEGLKQKYLMHLLSGDTDSEKDRLSPYFQSLHFKQKPEDKLSFMEQHTDALMIGDGLNDAGALKQAKVGIAVAEEIHQFSPSSDAIMRGDKLDKLDKFLGLSKYAMRVVYAAFGLSFLYNAVGLSFAVTGNLTPLLSAILMPISSVTVVGFITAAISIKAGRVFKTTL